MLLTGQLIGIPLNWQFYFELSRNAPRIDAAFQKDWHPINLSIAK